jgi:cell division cycle 14
VDGSTPSPEIVQKFIELVDANKEGTAVHCKAGLGRTGTLIALWAMKHYRFCAADFIGWIRVLRPGSILGPQQQFLLQMQKSMFRETDKSDIFPTLPLEYKQYVAQMEKTDLAVEAKMTEEESNIARFGQMHQGGGLVDAKLLNKA